MIPCNIPLFAVHNFGGTDGMKGDLAKVNEIPFGGMAPEGPPSSVWGTGFTPEGIGPPGPPFASFSLLARALNAAGRPRVTLSPR